MKLLKPIDTISDSDPDEIKSSVSFESSDLDTDWESINRTISYSNIKKDIENYSSEELKYESKLNKKSENDEKLIEEKLKEELKLIEEEKKLKLIDEEELKKRIRSEIRAEKLSEIKREGKMIISILILFGSIFFIGFVLTILYEMTFGVTKTNYVVDYKSITLNRTKRIFSEKICNQTFANKHFNIDNDCCGLVYNYTCNLLDDYKNIINKCENLIEFDKFFRACIYNLDQSDLLELFMRIFIIDY